MNITDKIRITNEDNMELMSRYPDNYFDLAIVDPPYGHNALDGSRTKKKYGINRGENWDCYRPDKEYFNELQRVSKNQIVWGGNYFISDLVDTKCFIIWDKKIAEGMNNYAMCEMAWTSFNGRPAKIYRKIASQENRIHPTQKPVKLYEWLLMNYAKEGDKILDTHLGSGSIAIACHNLGFELTACELDKDYYEAAIKRINNRVDSKDLFDLIRESE
jgi:site-specific DNA-methyltransferase (adenine-specific)